MINRRKLLLGTGAAVAACALPHGGANSCTAVDLSGLVPEGEEREHLLYELARLDARYYTEEGVAMVLACENLAPSSANKSAMTFDPDELNKRFARAFQHYVKLLDELRRDLGEQDAVAVLEFLAWRDVESGGGVAP